MEEAYGDMDQTCHSLGLVLNRYDLAWFLDLTKVDILLDTYLMIDISLLWLITKHKGRIAVVDKILEWLHWIFYFT
jgi:hypothetical protein